jgi:hypothetical protein
MKKLAVMLGVLLLMPGLACTTAIPVPGETMEPVASAAPADAWPRELTSGGNTFLIFQPQYDRWAQGRLDGRAAVAVESQASPEARYGGSRPAPRWTRRPGWSRSRT